MSLSFRLCLAIALLALGGCGGSSPAHSTVESLLRDMDAAIRTKDREKFRSCYEHVTSRDLETVDLLFDCCAGNFELREKVLARFGNDGWERFLATPADENLADLKPNMTPREPEWWMSMDFAEAEKSRQVFFPNSPMNANPLVQYEGNWLFVTPSNEFMTRMLKSMTPAMRSGIAALDADPNATILDVKNAMGRQFMQDKDQPFAPLIPKP